MIEKNYSISGDGFLTIAHISDLHNKDGRQAIESMRNRKPDIIVITGDLVLRRRPTDDMLIVQSEKNVLPFLSECAQIAPTYMSLGNHEVMLNQDDFELIAQTGVELLDNRFVKTDKYVIGGLTSAYVSRYRRELAEMEAWEKAAEGTRAGRYHIPKPFWRPRMQETDYAWLDTFVKVPRYRILLSHHPEYWCMEEPMLINRNIDLVLSGHAHGGQFRLFGQGFFAPGQGWFPKYTSGIHRGKYGRMIISKGMANTVRVAPRLFNPTEVVYIEVVRGEL
ncbi:MAG: metallophosphoesterase [Lachnospiraceae bacterium]|nr:metallophosphoesterase [Lachnospiraceae bacterium]